MNKKCGLNKYKCLTQLNFHMFFFYKTYNYGSSPSTRVLLTYTNIYFKTAQKHSLENAEIYWLDISKPMLFYIFFIVIISQYYDDIGYAY